MSKILVISDLHIDAKFDSIERWPEFLEFEKWLKDKIKDLQIDYLVASGDYFDPGKRNDLLWSSRLNKFIQRCHKKCLKGSFWIPGNHDIVKHSDGITTLSTICFEDPTLFIFEYPVIKKFLDFYIILLPYPNENKSRYEIYKNKLFESNDFKNDDLPILVFGHHTISNARMGTESKEMAKGHDVLYPVEELKEFLGNRIKKTLFFNGHYHKPQTVSIQGIDIHIPGSPLRFDAGERNDECSIIFIDTENEF